MVECLTMSATNQVNHLLILDAADDKKAKYEALDQWYIPDAPRRSLLFRCILLE